VSLFVRAIEASHQGGAGAPGAVEIDVGQLRFAGSRVTAAQVALAGFDVEYTDGDHHLLEIVVQPSVPVIETGATGATVRLRGRLGLRGDGEFAQPYRVRVRCLLLCGIEPM